MIDFLDQVKYHIYLSHIPFNLLCLIFTEPTLQLVLKVLHGLIRWFSLGIHLNIPYSQVKALCRQYGDDDERGLTEVINSWIKSGEASWPSLAIALKNIGEIDRARQITTEYGILYIYML